MRIYEYMRAPAYYIVEDGDGYWLVPGVAGGWNEREPFVGHVMNLRPLADPPGELGLPDD